MNRSNDVIETLADLVRINSVNPNYPGGVDELAIAEYVESFFRDRAVETRRRTVLPNRPNILATLPGRDRTKRGVLEAHLDTVAVAGMSIDPWDPQVRDGKLFGRGGCDTKGGMAAMMHAVAELAAEGIVPPCDVLFAATIDEEYSYRGVATLCETTFRADAAIVTEPTELRAVVASKGVVRWKIETVGKAAHSSKPHLGINAIEQMATVISALRRDARELARRTHPLLGPATCNVGVIRGGVQVNFVPDRCEIEIDRRLLPGETVESALGGYEALLDRLHREDPNLNAVMHPPMLTDVPLETAIDAPAVRTMQAALRRLGLDDEPIGVPFGSDASKFGAIGIPSMILGPGSIDHAHAAVEFVDCRQVRLARDVYREFILAFDPSRFQEAAS